jgi:hypothetical protein
MDFAFSVEKTSFSGREKNCRKNNLLTHTRTCATISLFGCDANRNQAANKFCPGLLEKKSRSRKKLFCSLTIGFCERMGALLFPPEERA